MTKLLVIGIDGASWNIIKPNLAQFPNLKALMEEGRHGGIFVEGDNILSAAIWATIFSGKSSEEHGHKEYVIEGKLQKRNDIKVDFVWDILVKDYDIRALQIPFVVPHYNFNCKYQAVGYGVSYDLNELNQDMDNLTFKALEVLKENPDIFIVVYNMLDRVQHFHWGEPIVFQWYKDMDKRVGMLKKYGEKIIITSDHGFCGRGEAKVQTLPDKNDLGEELKGDHHEEAILITKDINYPINKHKDIFDAIIAEVKI